MGERNRRCARLILKCNETSILFIQSSLPPTSGGQKAGVNAGVYWVAAGVLQKFTRLLLTQKTTVHCARLEFTFRHTLNLATVRQSRLVVAHVQRVHHVVNIRTQRSCTSYHARLSGLVGKTFEQTVTFELLYLR